MVKGGNQYSFKKGMEKVYKYKIYNYFPILKGTDLGLLFVCYVFVKSQQSNMSKLHQLDHKINNLLTSPAGCFYLIFTSLLHSIIQEI